MDPNSNNMTRGLIAFGAAVVCLGIAAFIYFTTFGSGQPSEPNIESTIPLD